MIAHVLMAALAAAPEQAAVEAYAAGNVPALVQALHEAKLDASATALLAQLAHEGNGAARDELVRRAAAGSPLGRELLARDDAGKLPGALALELARLHLQRALQLAPPDEAGAFAPIAEPPAAQNASATPLEPGLAAEMGAPKNEAPPAPAPQPAPQVPPRAAILELDRARALAASAQGEEATAAEAHELAGLAALAAGDDAGAQVEFLAIAQQKGGGEAAQLRRDRALLQLARIAYASGNDAKATQLYARVGRGAPEWLDALFEASWAHFRRGEDEKALGNLLTLRAPFFTGRFFPEALVLESLVFYENCRYADARKALAQFDARYRPLHDGLVATLASLPTTQSAWDLVSRGNGALQGVPAAAREEVANAVATVGPAAAQVEQLAQELDSLDARSPAFRASPLAARLAASGRAARLALIASTGATVLTGLSQERNQLRELLGQELRLVYEIAGREKELAANPQPDLLATPHREPPHVADDEELWPFEGEYWRDELGSYQFNLGQRCRNQRKPLPVAAEPVKAAAVAVQPATP